MARNSYLGLAHNLAHQFSVSAGHFAELASALGVDHVRIDVLRGRITPVAFEYEDRNLNLVRMCQRQLQRAAARNPIRILSATVDAELTDAGALALGHARFVGEIEDDLGCHHRMEVVPQGRQWGGKPLQHQPQRQAVRRWIQVMDDPTRCDYMAHRLRSLADQHNRGIAVRSGQLQFFRRNFHRLAGDRQSGFHRTTIAAVAGKYRNLGLTETADQIEALRTRLGCHIDDWKDEPASVMALDSLLGARKRLAAHATRRRLTEPDIALAVASARGRVANELPRWLLQRDDLRFRGNQRTSARLHWLAAVLQAQATGSPLPVPFPADPKRIETIACAPATPNRRG